MRDSPERQYSREWLQYERQQPMYDESINDFYADVFKNSPVHRGLLDDDFIESFVKWLKNHKFSNFDGVDQFPVRHVIQGCTQFIDDLYQRCGDIQTFEKDYKYHWRLNNEINYATIDTLDQNKELLIAMPFPWISCIRDINFNFDHPAIQTFGISLSKGGIGGNRIGVRFARKKPEGAITIMNDFHMNQQPLLYIGLKFMEDFGPEYFWRKYESKYYKVCEDFDLTPTKTIHLAIDKDKPVGVRSLLRAI